MLWATQCEHPFLLAIYTPSYAVVVIANNEVMLPRAIHVVCRRMAWVCVRYCLRNYVFSCFQSRLTLLFKKQSACETPIAVYMNELRLDVVDIFVLVVFNRDPFIFGK